MKIVKMPKAMNELAGSFKKKSYKIGFVPTMGALHNGHLSLARRAARECDKVVVSIFVNPTQFAPGEDFKKYPRTFKKDIAFLKKEKVDVLFFPKPEDMYPEGYTSYVEVGRMSSGLCGKSRPGHFRGVATVVLKLFNIVSPDIAYFGQKDAQQFAIIKKMAEDLNIPLVVCAERTIREKDGLAMSSRNRYLTEAERSKAPVLYKSLKLAKELITKKRMRNKNLIVKKMREFIARNAGRAKVDYVDIVKWENLEKIEILKGKVLVAVAVWFGKTRLIDNLILKV